MSPKLGRTIRTLRLSQNYLVLIKKVYNNSILFQKWARKVQNTPKYLFVHPFLQSE